MYKGLEENDVESMELYIACKQMEPIAAYLADRMKYGELFDM